MTEAAKKKPRRMSFTNLDSGVSLEAQFNPEELDEELQVLWNELETQGGGIQPHQYGGTSNVKWSFKMMFNAFDEGGGGLVTTSLGQTSGTAGATANRQEAIALARAYLHSMCYKPRGAQDIIGGSPPRHLFVWPGLISVDCVLHRLKINFEQFDQQGRPMRFTAQLMVKEARVEELFSEDVFSFGTFRSEDL